MRLAGFCWGKRVAYSKSHLTRTTRIEFVTYSYNVGCGQRGITRVRQTEQCDPVNDMAAAADISPAVYTAGLPLTARLRNN